ncbi:MAG: exodeoxyribonuclease III [Hyphomicrobiales bacterium]
MRVASWNVNSVRQRTGHLIAWLKETSPDIVCLQELKCTEDTFPAAEIESLGYNIAVLGQKTFNGVAILSKYRIEDETHGLPGDEQDEQARYIEAVVSRPQGVVRIVSLYLPNGNPLGTEKFTYKMAWFDRLIAHARHLLTMEEPLVLAGDYNVIPEASDAKDPAGWLNDALFVPHTRAKFQELLNLGLTDAFRACSDQKSAFTFWDYQAGAWPKNNGIRIDHLLLSPQAADRLVACEIDKHVRAWEKPSDHVPIRADMKD